MTRILLITVAVLMISSVAMADAIGVYTDQNGTNCNLYSGFSQSANVIYRCWTPGGSTGARFKVVGPSGSTVIALTTPYVTIGSVANDLSIAFGVCVEGTFSLGTLTAIWAPGSGGEVLPSDGYPNIIMTDCSFGEYPAWGATFCVAQASCSCHDFPPIVETRQSTWGQVKALYR